MFGFGFAMAPFYSKICEVIGLNQIQQRDALAANTQVDATRLVHLQFDANLRNELPWTFKPLTQVAVGASGPARARRLRGEERFDHSRYSGKRFRATGRKSWPRAISRSWNASALRGKS